KKAKGWPSPSPPAPERWLDVQPDGAHRPAALMPFGSGPRVCPGRSLALAERRVVLVPGPELDPASLAHDRNPASACCGILESLRMGPFDATRVLALLAAMCTTTALAGQQDEGLALDVHRWRLVESESGDINYYTVVDAKDRSYIHAAYKPPWES